MPKAFERTNKISTPADTGGCHTEFTHKSEEGRGRRPTAHYLVDEYFAEPAGTYRGIRAEGNFSHVLHIPAAPHTPHYRAADAQGTCSVTC